MYDIIWPRRQHTREIWPRRRRRPRSSGAWRRYTHEKFDPRPPPGPAGVFRTAAGVFKTARFAPLLPLLLVVVVVFCCRLRLPHRYWLGRA